MIDVFQVSRIDDAWQAAATGTSRKAVIGMPELADGTARMPDA